MPKCAIAKHQIIHVRALVKLCEVIKTNTFVNIGIDLEIVTYFKLEICVCKSLCPQPYAPLTGIFDSFISIIFQRKFSCSKQN